MKKDAIASFMHAHLKFLGSLFWLWLSIFSAQAQIDVEFWFAVPEASASHGDQPIFLRMSSFDKPCNVKVYMDARNKVLSEFYLNAYTDTSINLSIYKDILENSLTFQPLANGLHVTSNEKISCYYEIAHQYNPGIFNMKGRNALGTEFIIPSQNLTCNYNPSAMDIVATEDSTLITVVPVCDLQQGKAGDTLRFWLNKGQTYSVKAKSINLHLGGTWVQTSKPVAITASEDSVQFKLAEDIVGDQLVPWKLMGKQYVVTAGMSNAEVAYVFGGYPQAIVTAKWNGGTKTDTVRTGTHAAYAIPALEAISIQSDHPVLVWHLSGIGNELGTSLVPPLECTGNNQLSFVRSSFGTFVLMVTCSTKYIDAFTVNGKTDILSASNFTSGPYLPPGISYATITPSTTQITVGSFNQVKNAKGKFHLAILNNLGASAEYGFYSNFAGLNLGPDMKICEGETVTLNAGGDYPSYEWDDGSTSALRRISTPGTYWVKGIGNDCPAVDTIVVTSSTDAPPGKTMKFTICREGQEVSVTVLDDGPLPGSWADGYSGLKRTFNQPGIYIFSKKYPCGRAIDSFIIFKGIIEVNAGPDTTVCDSSFLVLGTDSNSQYYYRWELPNGNFHTGSAKLYLDKPIKGKYILMVISNQGCGEVFDTVEVNVVAGLSVLDSVTLRLVTVDDHDKIQVIWNAHAKAKQYYIYKMEKGKEAEMVHQTRDTNWTDPNVEVHFKPYGYAVAMEDYCGNMSDTGSFTESILLKISGEEGNRALNWTPYRGWNVLNYMILRQGEEWRNALDTFSVDERNAENLERERCYRIYTENDLSHLRSYSNNVCKPFDPRLYIPNAFSPNGDGNNDKFLVKGAGIMTYHLRIYNRWGEEIFMSEDPNISWNGRYRDTYSPIGLYIYTVTYRGMDLKWHFQRGTVMLMR